VKNSIRKIAGLSSTRYLLAGGVSYFIEISALYAFVIFANTSTITATAISFWIGLIVSFLIQKTYTFKNRSTTKKETSRQIVLYCMLVAFNYVFTILFVYVLHEYEVGVIRTIALIITTLWNFYIYKRFIFRS